MDITKHPSFCIAKLNPIQDSPNSLIHTPFDDVHLKISGKTHTSVRYYAKKHSEKDP